MARPRPKANPTHWTLKPDGRIKGTYYRRLEDIQRGLKEMDVSNLPSGGQFLFIYYGCEKLGKGIVGIANEWEAEGAYNPKLPLQLRELKAAAQRMNLAVTDAELDVLFLPTKSARYWRNEIGHNFGPTNVKTVVHHSKTLNERMHKFLNTYTPQVLNFLKANYAHLLP
jgi:hypothetical protein